MSTEVCKFFLTGDCKFGHKCRNSHNETFFENEPRWQVLTRQALNAVYSASVCFVRIPSSPTSTTPWEDSKPSIQSAEVFMQTSEKKKGFQIRNCQSGSHDEQDSTVFSTAARVATISVDADMDFQVLLENKLKTLYFTESPLLSVYITTYNSTRRHKKKHHIAFRLLLQDSSPHDQIISRYLIPKEIGCIGNESMGTITKLEWENLDEVFHRDNSDKELRYAKFDINSSHIEYATASSSASGEYLWNEKCRYIRCVK